MEEKNKNQNSFFIITLLALFIVNAMKFLNIEGNGLPIPASLFNMIIILASALFCFYKNEIFGKKDK